MIRLRYVIGYGTSIDSTCKPYLLPLKTSLGPLPALSRHILGSILSPGSPRNQIAQPLLPASTPRPFVNNSMLISASIGANVDVVIWSEVETYIAVMCACLMCIRPLILKYLPGLFSTTRPSTSRAPYASGPLHNANSWSAKVASRIRAERASRHGIEVLGDEQSVGNPEWIGKKGPGEGRESRKIIVTTEATVEYEDDIEMYGVAGRKAESSVSIEFEPE